MIRCQPLILLCLGISEFERVANLTRKDFTDKYAYSGRPVIITDATKDWTASQVSFYSLIMSLCNGEMGRNEFLPALTAEWSAS